MSNKKLFASVKSTPKTVINEAGGTAFARSDKLALTQYVMTGCLNGTFYATEEEQLNKILELSKKVPTKFLAQLAVHARKTGFMKDTPALLAAIVASRDSVLLGSIFNQVIDSPKMLRNFVQIIRSGVTGRKSLGSKPKKLIQAYLNNLTDEQLFKANIGNDPSLQDIVKMVHPKPGSPERNAMLGYLLDKKYDESKLAPLVKDFEKFKASLAINTKGPFAKLKNLIVKEEVEIPNVPFQMLTALPLTEEHWRSIAKTATWTQARMNLNTFARHGALKDKSVVDALAKKLSSKEEVSRAKAFPYQLFAAFRNVTSDVPTKLTNALQTAADNSLENIPSFGVKTFVLCDVSGSMQSPATGNRGSATSKMTCLDVAALFASAILRKNDEAEVIPFDTRVHPNKLNPRDSVMTNAQILSSFRGGGTDCGCALAHLNAQKAMGDLIVMLSDNESWIAGNFSGRYGTSMMAEWTKFKSRNPKAKLVLLDITPNSTSQVSDSTSVMNIGGFSDNCFNVIKEFIENGNQDNVVKEIENISI